jgi:hypothetical protein
MKSRPDDAVVPLATTANPKMYYLHKIPDWVPELLTNKPFPFELFVIDKASNDEALQNQLLKKLVLKS